MKKLSFLFAFFLLFSCAKKQHDLTVKTQIIGLKKGTVYLKKAKDSTLVTLDSLIFNGNSKIELYSDIESPEVFFLYLNKNSKDYERIPFFADKGVTEISTTLKNFVFDAKINGSAQQKTWEEYKLLNSRLNNMNLDLIKENFEAQKKGDTNSLKAIQKEFDYILKRKYLNSVNFAINNRDSEVAPYIALTELYNAKIYLLDTINNSLTIKVKESLYGKKLQLFIDKIKKEASK